MTVASDDRHHDGLDDPQRRTVAPLLPTYKPHPPASGYDLYPSHQVVSGSIGVGMSALANALRGHDIVALDGMPGVAWGDLSTALAAALAEDGSPPELIDAREAMLSPEALDTLLAPYLGGDDPLFGAVCPLELRQLFDAARSETLRARVRACRRTTTDGERTAPAALVFGPGAHLLAPEAPIVYLELPKNELQYRARAGTPTNLGQPHALAPKVAYKRSFFVDWPLLERYKASLLPELAWIVDAQRGAPVVLAGDDLRTTLDALALGPVRARPWFEPGAWGGQWLKRAIPGLPQEAVNYAWSFEIIAPENGILLEQGGALLEIPWELLMAHDPERIVGRRGARFGRSFPIRFDLLDTVEGGNLSLQCHPRTEFMAEHFGEPYTQDETYYILDAVPDAAVYLGFQEGVTPEAFGNALRHAAESGDTLEVDRYVQRLPAATHDLFLIPGGTVHCSGSGNLVLEISATPYIYTFKLYDWQRLDLDGRPRPLNIARGLENLDFGRSGDRVRDELVSHPRILTEEGDRRLVHLPTHEEHFYDVVRHEFDSRTEIVTDGSCRVMSLVEGDAVRVRSADGSERTFRYAETFVVPAAAGRVELINEGPGPAKVVDAFLKAEHA